jgi:hypothetical protein
MGACASAGGSVREASSPWILLLVYNPIRSGALLRMEGRKPGTFSPPHGEKFVKERAKPFLLHLGDSGVELFPEDSPMRTCKQQVRSIDDLQKKPHSSFCRWEGCFR